MSTSSFHSDYSSKEREYLVIYWKKEKRVLHWLSLNKYVTFCLFSLGIASVLFGFTEDIQDEVLIESVAMILLALLGISTLFAAPSIGRAYAFKVITLLVFIFCGGYILFSMVLLILSNSTDWDIIKNKSHVGNPYKVFLIYTLSVLSTLALLISAVVANFLHIALSDYERLTKQLRQFPLDPDIV